ncbi:DUF5117 domain-containing protein [Euzebyella marina]|uniref:DUF5117 domain-containing protein n=1 Tax=Euzebyella marina TaxID=1761453 RepID=A0A3G2L5L4_9FLAO|nr:zinc-dependent metalloprotease [Euzebyella marina]AYN67530.1 DUF5117 domain-containing protein [Euzebyella marina]
MKYSVWIALLWIYMWGYPQSPLIIPTDNPSMDNLGQETSFISSRIKGNQLYLKIPETLFNAPMLLTCYDDMRRGYMQVVWVKHRDEILLMRQSIRSTSGIMIPIKEGLYLEDTLLARFPIEKEGAERDAHWINATDFFLNQEIEWPNYGVDFGSPVPSLSLLLDAKNFDDEVIIKTRRGMVRRKSKLSIPIYFGLIKLGIPMKARGYDYRMGFYYESKMGSPFNLQNGVANITRWRLEKKFKNQKWSVPKKPISFLISPKVPPQWRPYIKAGIEEWLPAFEQAGFKDAIVVKEMDSLNDWEAHSIHSNVVYWNPKKYIRGSENKDFGGTIGHLIDERSGEILRGDIFMGASARTVMENYFIRAAPLDARARKLPFPDELIGELFQVIAAHEAGHVFGLIDANFGEYQYPWEKMNDEEWLRTMRHTPSVMNYTRTSNIPQPSDSISPSLLLRHVGPTDKYQIQWAYKEFPWGTTAQEEKQVLERMIRWQDSVPWYRFNNNQMEVIGPTSSNEVVETDNPIKSTELALKNLERVVSLLPGICANQKDNSQLNRLYGKTLKLYYQHMQHLSTLIGGYAIHYKALNQPGQMYEPIPWEEQIKALDFLLKWAFDPPKWLTSPDFLRKVSYSTFPDIVLQEQQKLLVEMLAAHRFKRLEYLEEVSGNGGFLHSFLTKLQKGLFYESKTLNLGNRRRDAIQKTYIDIIKILLEQEGDFMNMESQFFIASDYSKGLLWQELMDLRTLIKKNMRQYPKAVRMGHWAKCLHTLNRIL